MRGEMERRGEEYAVTYFGLMSQDLTLNVLVHVKPKKILKLAGSLTEIRS
jgi:hypothetical protein